MQAWRNCILLGCFLGIFSCFSKGQESPTAKVTDKIGSGQLLASWFQFQGNGKLVWTGITPQRKLVRVHESRLIPTQYEERAITQEEMESFSKILESAATTPPQPHYREPFPLFDNMQRLHFWMGETFKQYEWNSGESRPELLGKAVDFLEKMASHDLQEKSGTFFRIIDFNGMANGNQTWGMQFAYRGVSYRYVEPENFLVPPSTWPLP